MMSSSYDFSTFLGGFDSRVDPDNENDLEWVSYPLIEETLDFCICYFFL